MWLFKILCSKHCTLHTHTNYNSTLSYRSSARTLVYDENGVHGVHIHTYGGGMVQPASSASETLAFVTFVLCVKLLMQNKCVCVCVCVQYCTVLQYSVCTTASCGSSKYCALDTAHSHLLYPTLSYRASTHLCMI